jgi:hypothetical protein
LGLAAICSHIDDRVYLSHKAGGSEPFALALAPVTHLRWESHTAYEFYKSRIGAQCVPPRIEAQPDQPVRPLIKGFVEEGESSVVLTKSGMDERDAVGGHKPAGRQLFEFG